MILVRKSNDRVEEDETIARLGKKKITARKKQIDTEVRKEE